MTSTSTLSPQPERSNSDDRGSVGLIRRAVRTWTGELVDLGGRNTLLYYRDLKQGTLDIGPGSGADSRGSGLAAFLPHGAAVRHVRGRRDDAAARRARTVKAKATENYEERGLQTLFLAWGMATWVNTRGTRDAGRAGAAAPG